ncbi:hypothetical protein [Coprobacter sp.]
MPEEKTQKRVLYRTLAGQENSRLMQDNEETRFKNVYPVKHPDYGEVYPEPDEDWHGTVYIQGRGPLSPETTAATAAKKFRFIDVGSMNNPLTPVSHRRVTGRPIETPALIRGYAVTAAKTPYPALNPSASDNSSPAGNATPEKKLSPVLSNRQNIPQPSAVMQNPFVIQNDWIKGGFQDNPMIRQYMPEFSDRSWSLEKKNVRYLDASGNVNFRDMTPVEAPAYQNLKPEYNENLEKVYTDINEEGQFIQYPEFDVAKLYDPNQSTLADPAHKKIMAGLESLNSNPYYNQMYYDMSQKGGTYAWRENLNLNNGIEAQFVPKHDMIEFKNIEKMLPQNIEEELIHAAQKQAYGMDTMVANKKKYGKSIELEAKIIQDYIRTLKTFQVQQGAYPPGSYGMKGPNNILYNAFLKKIAKQGGFTEADLKEYYKWGRQLNQVEGDVDPDFYPQLLFRYFGKEKK